MTKNKHKNLGLNQQYLSARLLTSDSLRSPSSVDFVRSEENYTSSKPCNPQPTAASRHCWLSPKLVILAFVVLSFSIPFFAEGNALSSFPGEDLEANDVIKIVIGLSCWLTRIAFLLAIIFVIIAGLRFVVAQGNQTKYGEAVKNFRTVLLGILVIYGVYVIIATVAQAVGITDFSFIPLAC